MWFAETIEDGLAIRLLMFNFLPSWWYRHYGISWGKRMFFDADYRLACHQRMRRLMHERFAEIPIGAANPSPEVIAPELNNASTPALAGCEVAFPDDNYPWSQHLPAEAIGRLCLPDDLAASFPFTEVDAQVAYLNGKLSMSAVPRWYVRGVLNDAVLLRGSEFFEDLYADPARAEHVLRYAHDLLQAAITHNHAADDRSMVMLCNCNVMMVSPNTYEHQIAAYDRDIWDQAARLGVDVGLHHCGAFDQYSPCYRNVPRLDFIEIGSDSDIRLTLETFPEAEIQYILDARLLVNATREDVQKEMERILTAAQGHEARFRINVPDIEFGTPDENLVEIYRQCEAK